LTRCRDRTFYGITRNCCAVGAADTPARIPCALDITGCREQFLEVSRGSVGSVTLPVHRDTHTDSTDASGIVGLIERIGHYQLGHAGPKCLRSRSDTTLVHYAGGPGKHIGVGRILEREMVS
jgi:hypothetical protein